MVGTVRVRRDTRSILRFLILGEVEATLKKALILGGHGFIGSWMCQKLRENNFYVVAVDVQLPQFGRAPASEYHLFDLRNPVDFYDSLPWRDTDWVLNFAADMGGAEYIFSGNNDAEIMRSNVMINVNTLEACRRHGVKNVFFTSSACVYPSLSKVSFPEHAACKESFAGTPDSCYGIEKLFSESAYNAYARNFGMNCKVARMHNIFGEYGTWRGGREKAPAAFCRKIAEVHAGGTIQCFGDGNQTRSFLHVSEAVEGIWRLMNSDFNGPVNIGSSEMVTINKLIGELLVISGRDNIGLEHIPGPLGVQGRNSDNTLIFEKLGWKPAMSLRMGLEMTYPWIAEQVAKAKTLTPATL